MTERETPGTERCDADHLWVCLVCGKTSTTRYGFDDANKSTAMPGWDEACMMHAELARQERLVYSPGGRVIEVTT